MGDSSDHDRPITTADSFTIYQPGNDSKCGKKASPVGKPGSFLSARLKWHPCFDCQKSTVPWKKLYPLHFVLDFVSVTLYRLRRSPTRPTFIQHISKEFYCRHRANNAYSTLYYCRLCALQSSRHRHKMKLQLYPPFGLL